VPDSITRALSDDLNTPKAITELHRLSGDASKQAFLAAANFMGLMQQSADDWFKWSPADAAPVDEAAIEVLITERTEARASKDFARSDEIRDELAAQGIVLEDGADGTTWKRKNS